MINVEGKIMRLVILIILIITPAGGSQYSIELSKPSGQAETPGFLLSWVVVERSRLNIEGKKCDSIEN